MDFIWRMFPGQPFPPSSLCGTVLFILCIAALPSTDTVRAQNSELPTGAEVRIEFLKYGAMATNVAVSQDGNHIAIGVREVPEGNGKVVLWNRSLNKRVWRRSFATEIAPNVAFDSSGTKIAIAPGQGEVLIVRTGDGQTVEQWEANIPLEYRTAFETDASPRHLAFALGASQVVLRSGDHELKVLNYDLNPEKTIKTTNFCAGKIREVKIPANTLNLYFTTEAYAECNPDYLCVINPKSNTLVKRYSRKNISEIEPIGNNEIVYSRGKYVYRFNRQTGVEEVIYDSENTVLDLSYANGHLIIANSDVVILEV